MPTPPPLIEFLISSFIRNSVFFGFFPFLFATCIFRTCLQFIPHWPFITHVDDLPTHFIVSFSSDSLWFCYTFPLWLSKHFRVFSAHTHTQAPIFLSQRSHIVSHFPLQWILAYSIAACYLPLAIYCTWFLVTFVALQIRPSSSSATFC